MRSTNHHYLLVLIARTGQAQRDRDKHSSSGPTVCTRMPYSVYRMMYDVYRIELIFRGTVYNEKNTRHAGFSAFIGGCRQREIDTEDTRTYDTIRKIVAHTIRYALPNSTPDGLSA